MKMSNNEKCDLPCEPASARRSQVPGPVSEKLVTEDCIGTADQVPVSVNATGPTKKLIQQAFHPSLFITRPRSSSLGNISAASNSMNTAATMTVEDRDMDCKENERQLPPSWQRLPTERNPKRKKVSTSPPTRGADNTTNEGVSTSNRFTGLPIDLTDELVAEYPKKVIKPPPIILYGIEDVSKLTDLVNSCVPSDSYTYKVINRNQLRVATQNTEAYKNIIELMRKNGLIGHTFTQKQNKCYRIVVKNLHHTTPVEAIIEEIEKSGNKVRGEIICAKSRKNKMPLNMFFVNLEPSDNNTKVKDIEFIFNTRVKIEDPRKTNDIPQCTRCQQYGHTKNNCMRPYRCVKCAQGHRTTDCPKKDRNSPATCTLCLGNHPANYKGCQVYKEIRARKMMGAKKADLNIKENKKTSAQKPFSTDDFPSLIKTNKTYSRQQSATSKENNEQRRPKIPDTNNYWEKRTQSGQAQPTNLLEQIIIKQSEKIDILIQQLGTLMGLLTTLVAQCNQRKP